MRPLRKNKPTIVRNADVDSLSASIKVCKERAAMVGARISVGDCKGLTTRTVCFNIRKLKRTRRELIRNGKRHNMPLVQQGI